MALNRKQRRAQQVEQHATIKEQKLPETLTPIPVNQWPLLPRMPEQIWLSSQYMVQLYDENCRPYPGLKRLSICRTKLNQKGRWQDGLTWDELQGIKREIGYGDFYAVEVYPRDCDVVNVANLRHLWLMPEPLEEIGWLKS